MRILKRSTWNDDRLDELSRRTDEGFKEMRQDMQAGFARVDKDMNDGFTRFDRRFDRLTNTLLGGSLGVIAAILGSGIFG